MARALGKIEGKTSWRRKRWLYGTPPRSMLTRSGPTLVRPCYYSFDGGDYLYSPNNTDFDVTTGAVTIVVYCRFGVVNTAQGLITKFVVAAPSYNGFHLGIQATGKMRWACYDGADNDYMYRDSSSALSAGVDYAIGVTRDDQTLHVYLNGAANEGVQTTSGTVSSMTSNTDFRVGDGAIAAYGKLSNNSRVYAIQVFPAALTEAEIAVAGNVLKARSRYAWD